jgi:polysaccharide biosynthesis transport protein
MDSGPLIPANGRNLADASSASSIELNRPSPSNNFHTSFLPSQDSVLHDYARILVKRRLVVLLTLVIVFGVVAVATLRATRIYDAVGSIAVNRTDPTMVMAMGSGNGGGTAYYDTSDVETEVRVLQSDLLALDVIKQLGMDKLPEFGGSGSGNGNVADNTLEETNDALQPDSQKASALLDHFENNLNVSVVQGTRVIEIHYRSPDPNLASQVVNTLMSSYVEQNFKTKFETTMQISDWLQRQLVDLQIKVETSEEKLVKFQKDHDILGIDEKQNIITSKLDDLNKGLTQAEGERIQKESLYKLVQSVDADKDPTAALQIMGSLVPPGASPLLERLKGQHADLAVQIAQLSSQFGPSYPKVVQLNSQLKETDAQIQSEVKKVLDRVHGDYETALQNENMLRDALDKQKEEANKLNESGIEYSMLKRDVETNRSLYEDLLEKLKEAGVSAGLHSNYFRVVDTARPPQAPASPNVPRNLAFALVLGLASGVGLAFIIEGLDNTVRTPEQAQLISGLPSLGMIPLGSLNAPEPGLRARLAVASSREVVELVTQARPQSQMAESYRALRTSLLLSSLGAPPKIILITSALPQEGKTTTSINTAIVLAQKGSRVLLIDADLRRPSIHKALLSGPRTGLSNVLTGSATLEQAITQWSPVPTLSVLAAGTPPPNPAELLASANMQHVLDQLSTEYDHIVVDTPPTLSVTDAVLLSPCADTVILVIRSGQTTKQALRRARDILMRVNARVSGVLLNAADLKSADYYYYYEYRGKYGNRYYQADVGETQESENPEAPSPTVTSGGA